MTKRTYIISSAFTALSLLSPIPGHATPVPQTEAAQSERIMLAPLFEYPAAPDDMEDLNQRSNWLMAHFWDNMDFKSKVPVDQTRLNHAFATYVSPMQFATAEEVNKSVAALLKKLQKNETLLLQFTIAAEENLYGPRADLWIDDVYLQFLQTVLSSKKLPKRPPERWQRQKIQLSQSKKGLKAPEFRFTAPDGVEHTYRPMSTPTLLIFADAVDPQTRLALLRAESNVELANLLTQGKVNVLFINVSHPEADMSFLPARVTGGYADPVASRLPYDLRSVPTCFVVGKEGTIIEKTPSFPVAIEILKNQLTPQP